MALSEREQQMLEEMEQALYAEDPRFATSMKGGPLGGDLRRRRIIGAVGVIAGLVATRVTERAQTALYQIKPPKVREEEVLERPCS